MMRSSRSSDITMLTTQDFALLLTNVIITPDGKSMLKQVKLSGLQLVTTNLETGKEKRYYREDCKPLVKPMYQISVEHVHERRNIKSDAMKIIWALRNGYDPLNWLDDGLAILDE